MKLFFSILFFFPLTLRGQSTNEGIWTDTLPTTVALAKFKLNKKVVRCEYGKAIMYFNQSDYFKRESATDTILVTPKYFSQYVMSDLMQAGKANVVQRITGKKTNRIVHRMIQYGTTVDRTFEFPDGTPFFSVGEISGLMGVYTSWSADPDPPPRKAVQKKEFEYPEEFAVLNDKRLFRIRDYFPVAPGRKYVYDPHDEYGQLDSVMCKLSQLERKPIFYFVENGFEQHNLHSVNWTSFGSGIFCYQNDSLFSIETDYEEDLRDETREKRYADRKLVLPAYMSTGDSVCRDLGLEKKAFVLLKQEDIKIGNTVHKDCLKFKMLEIWPETIYNSYFWIQRENGLVKWMRSTGKIEELSFHY